MVLVSYGSGKIMTQMKMHIKDEMCGAFDGRGTIRESTRGGAKWLRSHPWRNHPGHMCHLEHENYRTSAIWTQLTVFLHDPFLPLLSWGFFGWVSSEVPPPLACRDVFGRPFFPRFVAGSPCKQLHCTICLDAGKEGFDIQYLQNFLARSTHACSRLI